MDKPPSIPEKNPKIDVIGLSYLISILFILKPKKFTNAAKIIEIAIIIETVFSSISTINLPPTIKPMTKKINNGRNLKLPNPFCICIWRKFVLNIGKQRSIIAVVGGRKYAITGTATIGIPSPRMPFIKPPAIIDRIIIKIKFGSK